MQDIQIVEMRQIMQIVQLIKFCKFAKYQSQMDVALWCKWIGRMGLGWISGWVKVQSTLWCYIKKKTLTAIFINNIIFEIIGPFCHVNFINTYPIQDQLVISDIHNQS